MKKIYLTLVFTFILSSIFSQSKDDFYKLEKKLGTDSGTEVLFHQMINDTLIKLNYPGMILGIEKIERKLLSNINEKVTPKKQRELYKINLSNYKKVGLENTIRRAEKILNDPKVMTLSHWIEFDKNNKRVLKYNLYNEINTKQNFLKNSISQIERIKKSLNSKLNNEKYTHIILASTGWNNDQKNSVNTYNIWLKNITEAAEKNNFNFKPYFIGLTWPSTWETKGGKVTSYFNKANDSDEIGMTFANLLIWESLIPLLENFPDTELILLGHSFGSRILTRAAHSKIILDKKATNSKQIDLMIAVQGAFSVNRFLNKKSPEGRLYSTFNPWKKFIATNSKYDKALDNAFYTTMIGNDKSLNKLLSKKAKVIFNKNSVDSKGEISKSIKENIHNIIVSDDLIYQGDTFSVKAHSDNKRPEFGVFIYNILSSYK